MPRNNNILVTVEGTKEGVTRVLDTVAQTYPESFRKEYKVPHYKDLYRGRAFYDTTEIIEKGEES